MWATRDCSGLSGTTYKRPNTFMYSYSAARFYGPRSLRLFGKFVSILPISISYAMVNF